LKKTKGRRKDLGDNGPRPLTVFEKEKCGSEPVLQRRQKGMVNEGPLKKRGKESCPPVQKENVLCPRNR